MKKKRKTIKIGKIEIEVIDIIAILMVILVFAVYFLSPKRFLITTASYGKGSKKDNALVEKVMGKENPEERFKIYFQWYNVVHELGHGVLHYNSDLKIDKAKEEQLVNDFAVAYWMYYGETDKLVELADIANYAASQLESPIKDESKYLEYAEKNFNKKEFKTFNNYGWFQFTCVKESVKNMKSLEKVLKEMGIENYKLNKQKTLEYETINEETSGIIIDDAIENFNEWGLYFPKAHQKFSNNPNNNHSRPGRKMLGLFYM